MNKIEYDVVKKSGLSEKEIEVLLKKWQKRLGMEAWSLSFSVVDFNRPDFRQSGDFEADVNNKKAKILLTADPFRGDEEYTLVHELIHVLLFDLDEYSEKIVLKSYGKDSKEHDRYMEKLESTAHKLTEAFLGRSCSK